MANLLMACQNHLMPRGIGISTMVAAVLSKAPAISAAAAATLSFLPSYVAAATEKQRNPPVPYQRFGRSACRFAPAHRRHALARPQRR